MRSIDPPPLYPTRLYASGTAGETPSEPPVVQHSAVGWTPRDCECHILEDFSLDCKTLLDFIC